MQRFNSYFCVYDYDVRYDKQKCSKKKYSTDVAIKQITDKFREIDDADIGESLKPIRNIIENHQTSKEQNIFAPPETKIQ